MSSTLPEILLPEVPTGNSVLLPHDTSRGACTVSVRTNSKTNTKKKVNDLPDDLIEVCEVSTRDELNKWIPAWETLSNTSIERNVFFEPEMLLPALDVYRDAEPRVLLAYAKPRGKPNGEPVLCGLFPLAISSDQKQTRLRSFETWRYPQAFLTTPLLRSDVGLETLEAFWRYLEAQKRAPLFVTFNGVNGDGPFQRLLIQFLQTTGSPSFVRSQHSRALFLPSESTEAYFARWSRVRRHSVTRLEKRLGELGELTLESLQADGNLSTWLDEFLQLEANGWKGRVGTALGINDSDKEFTKQMLERSFHSGKLMMLALKLDGKTIAIKCNILSGRCGFAWKIAYDESLYKYSPGCVLEKLNVEQMHALNCCDWMDSCAAPNHPMIDSLWPDRRVIQSVSIPTQRRGSNLVIAALPMLRWFQKTLKELISHPKPKSHHTTTENAS